MRLGSLLGVIPFVAAAAVGVALRDAGPSPRARDEAAALLRGAAARVVAAGPAARAYVADVVYERRWDGGEVAVELRVAVAPNRDIRVEFRGLSGRHGDRTFGQEAGPFRGLAVRSAGLRRMLQLVRDPELAARNYRIEELGSVTVADRPATRLRLSPRAGEGRALLLTLDQATGIPLERREQAADGRELSAWRVTALTLDAVPPADAPAFDLPDGLLPAGEPDLAPAAAVMRLHEPGWLPPGFAQVDARRLDTDAGPIVHTEYTDGVARLAVVQWPAGAPVFAARAKAAEAQVPDALRQAMRGAGGKRGRRHGHGWGARVTIGGTEVRVLGDCDKATLQRVAEHLRAAAEGEP